MKLVKSLLIVLSTAVLGPVRTKPSMLEIDQVAQDITAKFPAVLKNATNLSSFSRDKVLSINTSERERITSQIMEKLRTLFNAQLYSVMELADHAENIYKNYTKNVSLDENYKYFDAKEGDSNLTKIHIEEFSDKVEVNLETSVVQTPTDVYQYAEKILTSIDWTKELDQKFKENLNKTETKFKTWQYIGLSDGVFRTYPGSLWLKDAKELEYFDCRQRAWYIEGSSSSKDMIILLDLSGSVIGNRLFIVKLAVMSLLDTLQENDFVNIIYFNKKAHYLKRDWTTLVQATERNKKILKNAVHNKTLKGGKTANVGAGFRLAFDILQKSRNSTSTTSNCTQTIAFFTDGVEGDKVAEDVFSEHNSEKKVRVFTYLVGREKGSPYAAVKWIACENKGYFYRIETLSDVRENIVKYINVLSRSTTRKPKWTPLYQDAQGLGMLSALVVPIFDIRDGSGKRGKQLGVIGTDIMLAEIMSKIPEYQLGPGGYAFSITNNGLVFFHPRLKEEELINLKSPPNVYLSEVERYFDDNKFIEELAKAMIDRKAGVKSAPGDKSNYILAKYNGQFRIVKRKFKYFYDHITNTSFSVAIAMTDYGSNNFTFENDNELLATNHDVNQYGSFNISVAKWPYCNEYVKDKEELFKMVDKIKNVDNCRNKTLMKHVLYDLKNVKNWKPELSVNVSAVFFGTISGLTFFKSKSNQTTFGTSIKEEYFERAADYWEKETIVFSASQKNRVSASQAMTVQSQGGQKALWGVIGVHVVPEFLQNILQENTKCLSDQDTSCYLVDENGYIVVSGWGNQSGEFFGEVEGTVMKDLINRTVFFKYWFVDVQSTCASKSDESSSSVRILDPLYAFASYAKWWTKTIALSFIHYSFYAIMTATDQVKASSDNGESSESCFKKMGLFIRKENNEVMNGFVSYEGCDRYYASKIIDGTNLLLIMVKSQNNTFCAKKTKKITNDSEEFDFEEEYKLTNPYRRQPEEFGGCTPHPEETGECSSGKSHLSSFVLVVLLQIAFLVKTG